LPIRKLKKLAFLEMHNYLSLSLLRHRHQLVHRRIHHLRRSVRTCNIQVYVAEMAAEAEVPSEVVLVSLAGGSFNLPDQLSTSAEVDQHLCSDGSFVDRGSVADQLNLQPVIRTAGISEELVCGQ